MQDPGVGVVVVRAAGVGAGGGAHAVAFREPAVEGGQDPAGADAGLGGQFLGGEVGLVEVVAAPVEELPDLLVRGAGGGRPGVGAPLGDLREPVGQQVGAAPQRQQDLRHPREPGGEFGEVGGGDAGGGQVVGEGLAQVGDEPPGVALGEETRVDAEGLGDPQQHGDGERAGVVLHLVEVAGRDGEDARQFHLAEPPFLTEPAQPGACVRLAHRASSRRGGHGPRTGQ